MNNVTLSDEAQICPPVLEPAHPAQRTQSPNARRAFIYALTDPRDGQIRYVGKALNPNRRLWQHITRKDTSHKCSWILGLKSCGLQPNLEILEEVDELSWADSERFWISTLSFYGFKLTNLTAGGDASFSFTNETREKMAARKRGRKLTEETKQKLRIAMLGKPKTAEAIAKYKESRKGWKPNPENMARLIASNVGRKQSEETRQKRANKIRGLKRTPETKTLMSASISKWWHSRTEDEKTAHLARLQAGRMARIELAL